MTNDTKIYEDGVFSCIFATQCSQKKEPSGLGTIPFIVEPIDETIHNVLAGAESSKRRAAINVLKC